MSKKKFHARLLKGISNVREVFLQSVLEIDNKIISVGLGESWNIFKSLGFFFNSIFSSILLN